LLILKDFFRFLVFLVFLFLPLFPCFSANSARFTPEQLFDAMEKSTQRINALRAVVELSNSGGSKEVTLSVKNPDKFAIIFSDGTIQTYFNGQRLWIYLQAINEVFYHYSDQAESVSSYFSFFSPRKIFTNMTRKSLFALFKVTSQGKIINDKGQTLFRLNFVPKMQAVFKKIFEIGNYLMYFSETDFLPVEVVEFAPDGKERGRLKVVRYDINEQIDDADFNFVPPEGAVLVPIKVVIAQKIEEYARSVVESIEKAAGSLKKSLWDWSF